MDILSVSHYSRYLLAPSLSQVVTEGHFLTWGDYLTIVACIRWCLSVFMFIYKEVLQISRESPQIRLKWLNIFKELGGAANFSVTLYGLCIYRWMQYLCMHVRMCVYICAKKKKKQYFLCMGVLFSIDRQCVIFCFFFVSYNRTCLNTVFPFLNLFAFRSVNKNNRWSVHYSIIVSIFSGSIRSLIDIFYYW